MERPETRDELHAALSGTVRGTIIEALRYHGGEARSDEIAEYAGIRSNRSYYLGGLAEWGLLEHTGTAPGPRNHRTKTYRLTHEGRSVATDMADSPSTAADLGARVAALEAKAGSSAVNVAGTGNANVNDDDSDTRPLTDRESSSVTEPVEDEETGEEKDVTELEGRITDLETELAAIDDKYDRLRRAIARLR